MPEELKQALNQDQDPPEPDSQDGNEPDPSQAQTSEGDPLDPNIYDDGGVPWKNRAMEYQRKMSEAEQKARIYEQTAQQQRFQPQPQATQQQPQSDPYEELINLSQTDPKRFLKELETRIETRIKHDNFEYQRRQSVQRAFSKHPDLNNPQSEFYREVDSAMRELQQMGLDHNKSPNAIEVIADRVARRTNGHQRQPQTPAPQPTNLPFTGRTPSKTPQSQKPNEMPPLRDGFAEGLNNVADLFSKEELERVGKNLRERDARGDFRIGETT